MSELRLTRRRFLRVSAAAGTALLVPGALETLFARAQGASPRVQRYGPLIKDPDGLLDLPADFKYRAFSMALLGKTDDPRFSQHLSTGELVPALHDGMGAFQGIADITVLVRNHEIKPEQGPIVDAGRVRPYDKLGRGGTTTLWVNSDRQLSRSFPSLSGTMRNCAGGITPWGSWLSCEECTYVPGPRDPKNEDMTPDVSERHGYVFEVDSRSEGLVDPVPIKAMGRFYHEALAVDPETAYVYLSEDRPDGLLYRFRPDVVAGRKKHGHEAPELQPGDLAKGGVLEALRIVDKPGAKTQNWGDYPRFVPGQEFRVDWVEIPNRDPDMDMERDPTDSELDPLKHKPRTASTSTRAQGFALGAAQFARTEGVTYHHGSIYLCCTDGGRAKLGQVWRLETGPQKLSLLVEPDDQDVLDGPDNIVVAPNGDLIVCEDGKGDNFVVGITRKGHFYHLARNAFNGSEFAGACFSPDGETLFVNIQNPGITFAIWGPWGKKE